MVGLVAAFVVTDLIFVGRRSGSLSIGFEALLFGVTLPVWVVVARLYGLYSQDDQRTNHVTSDEVANVFNMVTVCTWLFFATTWVSGVAHPAVPKLLWRKSSADTDDGWGQLGQSWSEPKIAKLKANIGNTKASLG